MKKLSTFSVVTALALGTTNLAYSQEKSWEQTLSDASKEGRVIVSVFSVTSGLDAAAKRFGQKYGIKVELTPARAVEFRARWDAERQAGKPSTDIRISGSPENRSLAVAKLDQPFGKLPEIEAASPDKWIIHPLIDVKAGNGNTLHWNAAGFVMLANNKLVPESMGLQSYRDLADPKFRGLLLLDEPVPPSPGSRWAASTLPVYGEPYIRAVLANVKALTRQGAEAARQIVRGEYGVYVHLPLFTIPELFLFPEPRPFRVIVPSDGQMVATGGASLMQGAPNPNAARVFLNYLVSKEGQQVLADAPGSVFIRTDVKPKQPELVQLSSKLFPNYPETFDSVIKEYPKLAERLPPLLKDAGLK